MSNIRVYSKEEQERLVRMTMPQAGFRLGCLVHRKQGEILELAIRRCIELGVEEYGDAALHYPLDRLEQETKEELADAMFYQSIYALKETKVIP